MHLGAAEISAYMVSPPPLSRLLLAPQTLILNSEVGLCEFPPTREKSQEIRVMGPNHGPHRRHRKSVRISAGEKRAQLGSGGSEPG